MAAIMTADPNNPQFESRPTISTASNPFDYMNAPDPAGQQPDQSAALPGALGFGVALSKIHPLSRGNASIAAYTFGYKGIKQSRTILEGAKGAPEDINNLPGVISEMGTNLNPRYWTRYRSMERMYKKQELFGNGLIPKAVKIATGKEMQGGMLMDPNMLGRLGTISRLGKGTISPEQLENVQKYIKIGNPEMAEKLAGLDITTGREASYALGVSAKTTAGQYMSGFMHQAKFGGDVAEFGEQGWEAGKLAGGLASDAFVTGRAGAAIGREALEKGAGSVIKRRIEESAAKKVGTELAEKAGVTILEKVGITASTIGAEAAVGVADFWNPIGWALLAKTVWDTSKLIGSVVNQYIMKPLTGFVESGVRSFVGQGFKKPFGMGYIDNSVAATSRARGVDAIQNSRLNARSALGNEAAMMHAHFS